MIVGTAKKGWQMKPVCVKCEIQFEREKNGVEAKEMRDKEKTSEYRIWSADKWKCPGCGTEILSGFANRACYPGYENYEERDKNVEVVFF